MTKEELIKIYSAYFPYDLKVKHSDYEREIDSICRIVSLSEDEIIITNSENDYVCQFEEIKPVLYDLSYLTKEIEHRDKRFVPIVELLNLKFPYQQGRYKESDFSSEGHPCAWFVVDAGKTIRILTFDFDNEPYWVVKKLIEWHFNVFQIPETEFINKATLNK